MAYGLLNRAAMSVSGTPGTGTITLNAAATGYLTFAAAGAVDGDTYPYLVTDGADWELGYGVYTSSGTTLSRAALVASSTGSALSLTSAAVVECVPLVADVVNKRGDALTGALDWAATVDVASAGTTDIGAANSNRVRVTGTTTITSFGTGTHKLRQVRFAGILTLTHNGTSLILPGGSNITTAAGDAALAVSDGSGNWRVLVYQRASGKPITASSISEIPAGSGQELPTIAINWATASTIASGSTVNIGAAATNAIIISGTTTITAFDNVATNVVRFVRFSGILTLTHNGTSLILPGGANITTAAGDCAMMVSEGSGNWRCWWYSRAAGGMNGLVIGTTVQGYDADTAKTDVASNWTKPQTAGITALTSGTTITPALADGPDFSLTIAHNATLANPSDIASYVGLKFSIVGVQDATGGRTLAYGNQWFPVGAATAPAIPAGANAKWRIDGHVATSTRIDFIVSSVGV